MKYRTTTSLVHFLKNDLVCPAYRAKTASQVHLFCQILSSMSYFTISSLTANTNQTIDVGVDIVDVGELNVVRYQFLMNMWAVMWRR